MSRRQASRVQEEIPEDLLASIPDVNAKVDETTFAIEHEEVIALPAADADAPSADGLPPGIGGSAAASLAQQLRYDLGEALARELDRGAETIAAAVSDLETRLMEAESALAAAQAEVERERAARETAERRLQAFKELALK